MDILFVIQQLDYADHISIAYLSAIAKQLNHSTHFCSLDSKDLTTVIKEIMPDVVAYSANVLGFSEIVEEHKKAIKVHKFVSIMGGPQATFSPETFSESGMDAYCIGEGEYAFRDFLIKVEKEEPFDDVPNLITRDKHNKIIINPVRHLIENLDELPLADRDLTLSNSFLKDTPKKTFYATRGCPFECAYCLPKGTLVLTDELTYVPIENIKIGDMIIGVNEDAAHTKFCPSKVLNTFRRTAKIYEIKTMGGSVRSTEEHPWLSEHKRWRKTKNFKPGQFLRRVSLPIKTPFETKDYKLGYITGAYDGDSIMYRKVFHPYGIYDGQEARLVGDYEMMDTVLKYSNELGIGLYEGKYDSGKKKWALDSCVRSYKRDIVNYIENMIKTDGNDEYKRGFLAGIYDSEGGWSINYVNKSSCSLRIHNTNCRILEKTERYLNHFGFKTTLDICESPSVRILGGINKYIDFMSLVNPKAENKKQGIFYTSIHISPSMIIDIIPRDVCNVYNLETSTQNFIADGFVTHNCCNNYYHKLYKGKGQIVRRFSVERIIREIEDVKSKYRTDFIKFEDDLFVSKADAWLEEFAEIYPRKIGIPFNCYLRFDIINDDILRLLKRAGCYSVHLSVDSTSKHVRDNILKRKMKDIDIAKQLRKIREYGINTWVNYMLAAPESTLQDDIDTIKLSREANVTYTAYSTTVPMKGTELYNFCIEKRIIDPITHKGDMTGCSTKSTLSCFTEKEKNIRYNIYLLGAIIAKFPFPIYEFAISLIKIIPPNRLFKKIHDIYFEYNISNRIFKLN